MIYAMNSMFWSKLCLKKAGGAEGGIKKGQHAMYLENKKNHGKTAKLEY